MAALSRWTRCAALAGLALATTTRSLFPACTGLEVLETVVDRDGDVLVVEDILEGFGRVPVSVAFSPASSHMFMGFKAGEVRIYPDGGDTLVAAVYDSCVDMEDKVRSRLLSHRTFRLLLAEVSSFSKQRLLCGSNAFLCLLSCFFYYALCLSRSILFVTWFCPFTRVCRWCCVLLPCPAAVREDRWQLGGKAIAKPKHTTVGTTVGSVRCTLSCAYCVCTVRTLCVCVFVYNSGWLFAVCSTTPYHT